MSMCHALHVQDVKISIHNKYTYDTCLVFVKNNTYASIHFLGCIHVGGGRLTERPSGYDTLKVLPWFCVLKTDFSTQSLLLAINYTIHSGHIKRIQFLSLNQQCNYRNLHSKVKKKVSVHTASCITRAGRVRSYEKRLLGMNKQGEPSNNR